MTPRYFFVLCALALIAAVIAVPAEEVEVDEVERHEVDVDQIDLEDDDERGVPAVLLPFVTSIGAQLAKRYIKIKVKCLPDAHNSCTHINPALHPIKYYNCLKAFYDSHAERCLRED